MSDKVELRPSGRGHKWNKGKMSEYVYSPRYVKLFQIDLTEDKLVSLENKINGWVMEEAENMIAIELQSVTLSPLHDQEGSYGFIAIVLYRRLIIEKE